MSRRSARLSSGAVDGDGPTVAAAAPAAVPSDAEEADPAEDPPEPERYFFEGVWYPTYQDYVDAKRRRNRQVLIDSGLQAAVAEIHHTAERAAAARKRRRSLSARKREPPAPRRSSDRIRGIRSDGRYVEDERAGRFRFATDGTPRGDRTPGEAAAAAAAVTPPEPEFRSRINDGADLSLRQALRAAAGGGGGWTGGRGGAVVDGSEEENQDDHELEEDARQAQALLERIVSRRGDDDEASAPATGGSKDLDRRLRAIQVDTVAKVTRDRIYSVAAHPSAAQLLVAAGDKQGHIGLWNVDGYTEASPDEARYEFKYHTGAVNSLNFTSHTGLLSSSYDGTVRLFDLEKQSVSQVFATFDDSPSFRGKLGYKLDTGYHFWTQYLCLDHRGGNGQDPRAFFQSTSTGVVYHVDLRANQLSFHHELSEKKINSVSLHPDGHALLTAGLDCQVTLWDLRNFGGAGGGGSRNQGPSPVTAFHSSKSVNSAFFSPSGKYVVSTTMADKLDVFVDMHLSTRPMTKPSTRIVHDNRTGRWLSTFMATWHPSLDIFTVGSMRRPREIQVFDGASARNVRNVCGDDLTAVASRCCFHTSAERLAIVGGNSSGRVTVLR